MKMRFKQWTGFFLLAIFSTQNHLYADIEDYDPSTSVFRFQKQMAKRGNAESQFKLGLMYETGSGVKQSPVLATSWYNKAATQKHKPAINRLTYLDIKKSGFSEKHNAWLEELKTDARFHEGEALFLLGQMYAEGTGVEQNIPLSLNLLRKASAGNIPGADAEIIRIEGKLVREEQKKIKIFSPIIVVAPHKAAAITTVIPLALTKTKSIPKKKVTAASINIKTKKNKPKKQNRLIAKTNKTTPPQRKIKPKTKSPKKVYKAEPIPVTAVKTKEKTKPSHPMDRICGGSNRFRRGCR